MKIVEVRGFNRSFPLAEHLDNPLLSLCGTPSLGAEGMFAVPDNAGYRS